MTAILSILCSALVGCVFLLTGALKVFAPSSTVAHFRRLNLMPWPWLRALLWTAATGECALGVALVARVFPERIFPATIALVAVLAAFTGWSGIVKKTEDCGCYGKLMKLSPAKSVALDGLYAALAVVAWRLPVSLFGFGVATTDEIAMLAITAMAFAAATTLSHNYYLRSGKDVWDLNPIRVNRKWNPDWLAGYTATASGRAQIVVLMSPTCPQCKLWVKPLNKMAGRADMPQVIAGMAASKEEIERVARENGIAFPVLEVQSALMARMADGFPIIVSIEEGVVRSRGAAQLPPELLERLKGVKPTASRPEPAAAMLRQMPDPA